VSRRQKTLACEAARAVQNIPWKKWGPYLSDRQWGTVREDYSANGDAWNFFTHDHARSRAYRWGEDGLGGAGVRAGLAGLECERNEPQSTGSAQGKCESRCEPGGVPPAPCIAAALSHPIAARPTLAFDGMQGHLRVGP
jgi:hypothetical protein